MVNKFSRLKGTEGEAKATYKYPSLHPKVKEAVSDSIPTLWYNNDDNDNTNQTYSTHVMGKFQCNNVGCSSNGWGSKKVAIQIRGYPGNGYNAIVFSQRCMSCNTLGAFKLDVNSYIERITYRVKRWAGVKTETQPYDHKVGPPHKKELCEGCRLGVCREVDE